MSPTSQMTQTMRPPSSAARESRRATNWSSSTRGLPALLERLDEFAARGPLDLAELERLFHGLELRSDDLAAFQLFSPKCYQRNRIRRTEHYEMLLICWAPGQASPIHDHTGSACAFRVISGRCSEQRYLRASEVPNSKKEPLAEPVGEAVVFERDSVCVSEDADIHRVGNPSSQDNLCTLHLYSPPLDRMRCYRCDSESLAKRASPAISS